MMPLPHPGPLQPIVAFTVGPTQIAFIVVLAFLLFGAQKIPELMRSLGRAQGEFQKAKRDFDLEAKAVADGERATDASSTGASDEEALASARARAASLGIDASGKDLDTLKREIADKVIEDNA